MALSVTDLEDALVAANDAGDFGKVESIGAQLKAIRARKLMPQLNPAEGMSAGELYGAGFGGRLKEILTAGLGERANPQAEAQLMGETVGGSGVGPGGRITWNASPAGLGRASVDLLSAYPLARGAKAAQEGLGVLAPKLAQYPALTSIGTNAAVGGGFEGLTTPGGFGERGSAAGTGALFAGGGDVATRGLAGLVGGPLRTSKAATPGAQELLDSGVPVPFWKATDNKVIRDLAERAKVLPLARTVVQNAEDTAMTAWNKNLAKAATPPKPVLDDAGSVISWKTGEPVTKTGSEGLRELRSRYDSAYDALYKGRVIPVDTAFQTDVNEALRMTKNYLPSAYEEVKGVSAQVRDILKATELQKRGDVLTLGHAGVTNDAVKEALNVVEGAITEAWRAGQGRKADALSGIKDALLDMRTRGLPPEVQSMAGDINSAYRNFKILERASSTISANKAQMVTPDQILSAMRAADRTPGKSAFARGNVQGQGPALNAAEVLGNRLPTVGPGSAEKYLFSAGAFSPLLLGTDLGTVGALAAITSPQGQKALLGQYGIQSRLNDLIKRGAPYVAQGAGVLAP